MIAILNTMHQSSISFQPAGHTISNECLVDVVWCGRLMKTTNRHTIDHSNLVPSIKMPNYLIWGNKLRFAFYAKNKEFESFNASAWSSVFRFSSLICLRGRKLKTKKTNCIQLPTISIHSCSICTNKFIQTAFRESIYKESINCFYEFFFNLQKNCWRDYEFVLFWIAITDVTKAIKGRRMRWHRK